MIHHPFLPPPPRLMCCCSLFLFPRKRKPFLPSHSQSISLLAQPPPLSLFLSLRCCWGGGRRKKHILEDWGSGVIQYRPSLRTRREEERRKEQNCFPLVHAIVIPCIVLPAFSRPASARQIFDFPRIPPSTPIRNVDIKKKSLHKNYTYSTHPPLTDTV